MDASTCPPCRTTRAPAATCTARFQCEAYSPRVISDTRPVGISEFGRMPTIPDADDELRRRTRTKERTWLQRPTMANFIV